MKNVNTLFTLACFLLFSVAVSAQKKKLPEDLNVEKIVFFEYEELPIEDGMKNMVKRMYTKRNKYGAESNAQLKEAAKKYPFNYTISNRSNVEELIAQGYKYALDNDMMIKYNNGVNMYAGSDTRYVADMFVLNLETGSRYYLFEISSTYCYAYKKIMNKFINKVNKEFEE